MEQRRSHATKSVDPGEHIPRRYPGENGCSILITQHVQHPGP